MLNLVVRRMGKLAVVKCEGRIVRSDAAYKLREAVRSLQDARIIVLDLSQVNAVEGGGLGMIRFLQSWAYDRDIQLKLFNPIRSVRDRLEQVCPTAEFDFATPHEVLTLIGNEDRRPALAA